MLQCDACSREFQIDSELVRCPTCGESLDLIYDYEQVALALERRPLHDRPQTLWRMIELLPTRAAAPAVGGEVGWTPLRPAPRLGRALGIERLYLKDDTVGRPTQSYKDRVVAIAIQHAVESGVRRVGCVSTGNVGNAVASLATRMGIEAWVVYPAEVEFAKIAASRAYGANVVVVEGTYDEANRMCAAYAAASGMPFVNISYRPVYAQGAKTLAFEVMEQLNWNRLDHLVLPVAGATLMTRVDRGLRELVQVGLLARDGVRLHAAQPAGSAPVAEAIRTGSSQIVPRQPDTIAHSLAIGAPADGGRAARAVTRRGGWAATATDDEVLEAMRLLGRLEGVYSEPAGGVVVAAARHLAEEGRFGPEETVVLAITGHGWKASSGASPGTDGVAPEPIACDAGALEAAIEGLRRAR